MRLVHECDVRAPAAAVFALGVEIEAWPALDPAYRWCRILDRGGNRTVFEMAGNIRGWPARWTARQDLFPDDRRIVFTHVRGLTTGMQVAWDIRDGGAGSTLRITHDFTLRWPLIGTPASQWIVGPIFIDWIARRTLSAVKRAAESRPNPTDSADDPAASNRPGSDGTEKEVTE